MLKHIQGGGNYGIATGFGNVVVIDSDHPRTQECVEEFLPKTLQVTTGKGTHNFFFCADLKDKIILNNDDMGRHYGEVQTVGQQVVGAGSTHPNGHLYKLKHDADIQTVTEEQVKVALSQLMKRPKITISKEETDLDLHMSDVIGTSSLTPREHEHHGKHPVHGSDSGFNFCVDFNKDVWHCFRHNTGGGALMWIAVNEGIIDCSDAIPGVLRGETFQKTLSVAVEKYGLKHSPFKKQEEVTWDIYSTKELKEQVYLKLALGAKKHKEITEMMADYFLRNNSVYVIRDDKIEEFWIYRDGIYIPHGKSYICEFCRDVLGEAYNMILVSKIWQKIAVDNFVEADKFFTINHKELVPVLNGLLNVVTKELSGFDCKKVFFAKLPVRYDVGKDCPNVKTFFNDIMTDESDVLRIQEIFGYLLYKELFIEKAFMFSGNSRNGKSKTIELMGKLLGTKNTSALSLQQLTKDRFMLADLFGKMANLAGDISNRQIEGLDRFKSLTGRDTIKSDRKFMTSIEFVSYAKQIFSCNQLPEPEDDQEAFWNRWEYLEFPFQFLPQSKIDLLDDKSHAKLEDTNIIDKLSTPDELSGLLNWSLIGLARLFSNKKFTKSQSASDIKKLWLRKSNSLLAFFEDHLVEDYDAWVDKREFRAVYSKYCRGHKVLPVNDKVIKEKMVTSFGSVDGRKINSDGQQIRVWNGVKFVGGSVIKDGCSTLYYEKQHEVTEEFV